MKGEKGGVIEKGKSAGENPVPTFAVEVSQTSPKPQKMPEELYTGEKREEEGFFGGAVSRWSKHPLTRKQENGFSGGGGGPTNPTKRKCRDFYGERGGTLLAEKRGFKHQKKKKTWGGMRHCVVTATFVPPGGEKPPVTKNRTLRQNQQNVFKVGPFLKG